MVPPVTYSLVIPTCNRLAFLIEAIQSAVNSAPAGMEIIVVNDGDPFDATQLPQIAIPITLHQNAGETGASGARNYGVAQAKGDWVFFLDDDDLIAPGYWAHLAATLLTTLDKNALAYGFCATADFHDRGFQPSQSDTGMWQSLDAPYDAKALSGLGKGFWVSRTAYETVGGLDTALRVNEDTEFCINLLKHGAQPYHLDQVGAYIFDGAYSANQGSVTASQNADNRRQYMARIIDKHADYLAQNQSLSLWLHKRLYKFAARSQPDKRLPTSAAQASLTFIDKLTLKASFIGHRLLAARRQKTKRTR